MESLRRFFLNVAHLSSDHVTPRVGEEHSSHGKSGVTYSRTERVAALMNNSKNTVVLLLYIYRGFLYIGDYLIVLPRFMRIITSHCKDLLFNQLV